jgi:acylphosphatase
VWFSSFAATLGGSLPSTTSLVSLPDASSKLRTKVEIWNSVDSSLTSLAGPRGFRRFVQTAAISVGLTGSIQRYTHDNVRVYLEGTEDQLRQFDNLVDEWQAQAMVGDISVVPGGAEENYLFRHIRGFTIHKSHSRPAPLCRHGVRNGKYSADLTDYDKMSEYSANSMQSG